MRNRPGKPSITASDATALYKLDADKETPNLAPIEYWPSTQAYRHIVSLATKLFGLDAEPLLMKIRDPDLALLAEIEMASTLLGTPSSRSSTIDATGYQEKVNRRATVRFYSQSSSQTRFSRQEAPAD